MGIIRKQAIATTSLNFIGIIFGSISRIIMPFILEKAQVGLVNLLDSVSGTFYSIFNFGYGLLLKRMFPRYRSEAKGHYGFFALGLMISITGVLFALSTYFLLKDYLLTSENGDNDLILTFSFLIPPLIVFRIMGFNTDAYVRMLFNTVIGTFLDSFLTKILLFTTMMLIAFTLVSFEMYLYLYVSALILPGIVIIIYAWIKTPKITLPDRDFWVKRKEVSTYLLFGILGGASTSIVLYIDQLMLNKMISIDAVGVYSIMFFASNLIAVPSRNLRKISSVIVAEAWKDKDMNLIENVYKKSALNLLIIGGYLFFMGWWMLPYALEFLPEYSEGLYVFFFLGIGRVFDLATGINSDIIETGPKYKFNTYINVLFAILVFTTNIIFIPLYGIIGAGLASCISLIFINIIRLYFLQSQFKLSIYTWSFGKSLIVVIVFVLLAQFVSLPLEPILSLVILFVVGTTLYALAVLKLRLSQDANDMFIRIMKRFKLRR